MDEIIRKAKSLITDIESMRNPYLSKQPWFGGFSEHAYDGDGVMIEWPNLSIAVEELSEAINKYEGVKVIEHQQALDGLQKIQLDMIS